MTEKAKSVMFYLHLLGVCHYYVKQKAREIRGKQQVKLRRMMTHCTSSPLFIFVAAGLTEKCLGLLNWSFDAFSIFGNSSIDIATESIIGTILRHYSLRYVTFIQLNNPQCHYETYKA
jgi:hypothetical protein